MAELIFTVGMQLSYGPMQELRNFCSFFKTVQVHILF